MPTYQYRCAACTNTFDAFQRFADDPLTECPACEGQVRRVIQPVGVVFKGSGWYINDSRKSTGSAKDKESDGESTKPETAKADSAKAGEAKADAPKTEPVTKDTKKPAKAAAAAD